MNKAILLLFLCLGLAFFSSDVDGADEDSDSKEKQDESGSKDQTGEENSNEKQNNSGSRDRSDEDNSQAGGGSKDEVNEDSSKDKQSGGSRDDAEESQNEKEDEGSKDGGEGNGYTEEYAVVSLLQLQIPDVDVEDFAYSALDFMESIDSVLQENELHDVSIVILSVDETGYGVRVTVAIRCFTESPPEDDQAASEYIADLILTNLDTLSLEVSGVATLDISKLKDFTTEGGGKRSGLSGPAIAGIVIGIISLIGIMAGIVALATYVRFRKVFGQDRVPLLPS